ncbi:hypothetical protein B0A48_18554 [Cryoendolithus antarcticus]|uniref:cutinase n=1 Tax=Cryoendolithus antarcticus TaxID=1507870 RepID=A0A1V8S8H0_9PEZI|nr:hypothetical protein B0A48_18554 [Cryoendolithus antarcticus]
MMKLLSLLAAAQALIGNNCLATPITATDQVDINSSAAELEKRGDLNFNEVVLGQCKNVIAIYAKGTSLDPNKNNYDAVGSAWFSNIVKQEGGAKYVVRQGVNYVADIPGAVFGNVEGGTELFRLIKQARSKCPSGKIVLGGYR